MSELGANMQVCNQELVKCLEQLKTKKNMINEVIHEEEQERDELEKNIQILQNKLGAVNGSLNKHKITRDSYQKLIEETEEGFRRIVKTGQTLLNLARKEYQELVNADDCVKTAKPTYEKDFFPDEETDDSS